MGDPVATAPIVAIYLALANYVVSGNLEALNAAFASWQALASTATPDPVPAPVSGNG